MKFLLDENQSPRIAVLLVEAGHDAIHVRDIDLRTSPDEQHAAGPSIVLLRRQAQRRAREIAALILANLDAVAEDL